MTSKRCFTCKHWKPPVMPGRHNATPFQASKCVKSGEPIEGDDYCENWEEPEVLHLRTEKVLPFVVPIVKCGPSKETRQAHNPVTILPPPPVEEPPVVARIPSAPPPPVMGLIDGASELPPVANDQAVGSKENAGRPLHVKCPFGERHTVDAVGSDHVCRHCGATSPKKRWFLCYFNNRATKWEVLPEWRAPMEARQEGPMEHQDAEAAKRRMMTRKVS